MPRFTTKNHTIIECKDNYICTKCYCTPYFSKRLVTFFGQVTIPPARATEHTNRRYKLFGFCYVHDGRFIESFCVLLSTLQTTLIFRHRGLSATSLCVLLGYVAFLIRFGATSLRSRHSRRNVTEFSSRCCCRTYPTYKRWFGFNLPAHWSQTIASQAWYAVSFSLPT